MPHVRQPGMEEQWPQDVDFDFDLEVPLGYTMYTLITQGDAAGIQALLADGACPNTIGTGRQRGKSMLWCAVEAGEDEIALLLLEAGADPNLAVPGSTLKLSPLMCACIRGSAKVVGALLAKGANLHVRSEQGITLLAMAAAGERQSACLEPHTIVGEWKECVRLLLTAGADPLALMPNGSTATSVTTDKEIKRLLRDAMRASVVEVVPAQVLRRPTGASVKAAAAEQRQTDPAAAKAAAARASQLAAELLAEEEADKARTAKAAEKKRDKKKAAKNRRAAGAASSEGPQEDEQPGGSGAGATVAALEAPGPAASSVSAVQSTEDASEVAPSGALERGRGETNAGGLSDAAPTGAAAASQQRPESESTAVSTAAAPATALQQAGSQPASAFDMLPPVLRAVAAAVAGRAAATNRSLEATSAIGRSVAPIGLAAAAPAAVARNPRVVVPTALQPASGVADASAPARAAASSQPPVSQQPPQAPTLEPIATASAADDATCCVVCMERPRGAVLLPCAHVAMCVGCCEAVQRATNQCPMCRATIGTVIPIFHS